MTRWERGNGGGGGVVSLEEEQGVVLEDWEGVQTYRTAALERTAG